MDAIAERSRGCLLGGALGDALGYSVEFLQWDEIRDKFGAVGIQSLQASSNGVAVISDDTQMTLFTAAGLLDAHAMHGDPSECAVVAAVHQAYRHWLATQGVGEISDSDQSISACLAKEDWLQVRRAPGGTCLTALASNRAGSMAAPLNDSKGCGGVMRAAPIGLVYDPEAAFTLGVQTAALTHGHPSGYFSTGLLAALVSGVVQGLPLREAISLARSFALPHPAARECLERLDLALALADTPDEANMQIGLLGAGWIAEETLAIAVYCSLRWPQDIIRALQAAVNHSGDSDSTGAVTGNILGTIMGASRLPGSWLMKLEGARRISAVADRLAGIHKPTKNGSFRQKI